VAAVNTIDTGALTAPFVALSDAEARALLEDAYGVTGALTRFATEKDDTFRVDARGGRLVLKVANPAETAEELDFQVELIRHAAAVDPGLPLPATLPSRRGVLHDRITDAAGQERGIRLMTFLEGTPLDRIQTTPAQRETVGEVLARLRLATAGFAHPGDSRVLAWDVRHVLGLAPLVEGVEDPARRQALEAGLERLRTLWPQVEGLRTQVLHNDFSLSNLVADHDDPAFLTGVIDFGDAVRTAVAVDVSTALLNQLPRDVAERPTDDLLAAGRDVLRGYLRFADLTEQELALIPHLVMARVVARALITTERARLFPENAAYIVRNTEPGWGQLAWFLARPTDEISNLLATQKSGGPTPMTATAQRGKMNNAFDPARAESLDARTRALVERRTRLLGPAYRLFYEEPVELVRGEGTRLYDAGGNGYLDAYNNVVSVGHAHPRVVEAVSRQLGTLCTHTRYLHEDVLRLAESILPSFGGRIAERGHLMLTCTGSEANDLAVRIAKHATGREGVIVTSEAYHGNSELTASFSPSLGPGSRLGTWVRRVPAPDSYRLPAGEIGDRLAAAVAEQIEDLERRGQGLAAFVVDSLFSSDGIYAQPTDVLGPVAEVVRRAGGVFVADEVQSGYARSGDALWGFQRHGLDPDIVTMGKPMGNGYPVAGIAVDAPLVAEFGRDTRYFNTFGGNTVAVAAAQAVLDVIRDEGLLENSREVGARLRDGLEALAREHPVIGDVRGTGLYVGVELVGDRESKAPDGAAAAAIVNGLRRRRVLISATGEAGNVLKIRPPLVFDADDAGRLLEALAATLEESA
jgi:4-aminobutyrate aminotransferase-like enzyme/Ser/Thr protein kinase RdoA (MazF antagonist)